MQIIATDTDRAMAGMLEGYDAPAILVTPDYRILATNERYRERFGEIETGRVAHCYAVSHGYDRPCDQAGEDCPLATALESGNRTRVLHIHQTPSGQEHVDVEMLPIFNDDGTLSHFVELLKPVPTASAQVSTQQMVGRSKPFNTLVEQISRVGPSDASVLLLGESGTGKELVAQAIHDSSRRAEKPMVTLECAGLTESLFESELFGHVKGAFTGANYNRQGLVASADGGTLFLDEVGDIPLPQQVKLLRLIETGMYRPVGSAKPQRSDFRLVCATHKDLWRLVEQGEFRQDLYFRINVFPLAVPSLSERREDIALLARSLLGKIQPHAPVAITEDAIAVLQKHDFPGNIRELRNVLARAVILSDTGTIDAQTVAASLSIAAARGPEALVDLRTLERDYLQNLLRQFDGDKARVARTAGISLRTLYRKLGAT